MSSAPSRRRRALRDERGASEGFILILVVSLLGFAGLSFDAGMALNARREATNIASAAARSGADVIDIDVLYSQGVAQLHGDSIVQAEMFALSSGADTAVAVMDSAYRLEVTVERSHRTTFLGIVGIDRLFVEATEDAYVKQVGSSRDLP